MEDFFRNVMHIQDDALIAGLCSIASPAYLAKGKTLYRGGEYLQKLYLLNEGGLRAYYFDRHGREITDCFFYEPGEAAMPSFAFDKPSFVSAVAYMDTTLVEMPLPQAMTIIKGSFEGRDKIEEMLMRSASRHCELKAQLSCSSAVERYEWFLQEYPNISGRVSDKHIATFLGMNAVTLSRMRSKLSPAVCQQEGGLRE